MTQQNGNNNGGADDGAEQLYTQAELNQFTAQARREGRDSARAAAAPKATSDDTIARAVEQGIQRGLAAIAQHQGVTQQTQQPVVAAAPNAPAKVDPITSGGLVDIFSLSPDQLESLGPSGLREHHQRILKAGAERNGAPPIPGATINRPGIR